MRAASELPRLRRRPPCWRSGWRATGHGPGRPSQGERSNSFSLSADLYHQFGQVQTNFLIEGFYTSLSHVFALRQLSQPDAHGNTVQERYNAYGAKVLGLNLEGKAVFTRWFTLQAGLTLQQSHYDEAIAWNDEVPEQKYKKMMRTPNTYGYFTATFTPSSVSRPPSRATIRAACS